MGDLSKYTKVANGGGRMTRFGLRPHSASSSSERLLAELQAVCSPCANMVTLQGRRKKEKKDSKIRAKIVENCVAQNSSFRACQTRIACGSRELLP